MRLVAFDLDGTLVRGETCVHAIGRGEECSAVERLAMRDRHGVTAAREQMAAWFDGHELETLRAGRWDLTLAPGARPGQRWPTTAHCSTSGPRTTASG